MKKYVDLCMGLLLYGLGIALVIQANLGAFPTTCMNLGISNVTGIGYGTVCMLVEILIIAFNIKNKEKIGLATLGNGILGGYIISAWTFLIPISANIVISVLMIVLGMVIMTLGLFFMTKCGLGNAATNGLMLVMSRRTGKSISVIRTIQEILFMLGGLILGGGVGVATILLSLGFGSVMGWIYKLLDFNPNDVNHKYIEFKKHERQNSVEITIEEV